MKSALVFYECFFKFLSPYFFMALMLPQFSFSADELPPTNGLIVISKVQAAMKNAMTKASTLPDPTKSQFIAKIQKAQQEVQTIGPKFNQELEACRKEKDQTDYNCFEGNDKGVNQFVSAMGTLSDLGGMAMSGACSKLADLMKMGKGAQLAFRAQCGMMRSGCIDECKKAEFSLKKMKDALIKANVDVGTLDVLTAGNNQAAGSTESLRQNVEARAQKECDEKKLGSVQCGNYVREQLAQFDKGDTNNKPNGNLANVDLTSVIEEAQKELSAIDADTPNSPTALRKLCEASANEATSKATMNIANLMTAMQGNAACADELQSFNDNIDLKDCNLTGTCTPTDPVSDCKDPKYSQSVYCKSVASNTGGSNTGGTSGTNAGVDPNFNLDGKNALGSLDMTGGAGDTGAFDPNDPNSPFNKLGDGAGSKSAGVPGGGGGGGLQLPGGGGSPRGGGGRSAASDFTSGAMPGYGAGNGFGGGGSSKDNLEKYLPGAEKDPTLAKKGLGPDGITASGSLTLFEKVSKSYRNNRSTLLPE